MKQKEHNTIIHSQTYKGFELYSNKEKALDGFYLKVIDKTITGLEEMFSNHKKLNVFRFDLYFKNNQNQYIEAKDDTNELVSTFFKNLKARLKRWKNYNKKQETVEHRKIKRILYQSVRERSREKRTHYHCLLAIPAQAQDDGKVFWDDGLEDYVWIYKIIVETWKAVCPYGIVNFGSQGYQNHYYYLNYSSPTFNDEIEDCIRGLSYLAKVYSKEIDIKHSKKFTSSSKMKRRDDGIKLM
ncbi:YagK/YfjJ domain-containing protein, partial [Halovibrio sp. HP20-50]|uniref:YagK/YfjJ domain-containing protein n=1 Tax=Halovibrio sp. HP20-59 TaxID=3080275 RepID=UPI00294AF5FB